MPGHDHRHAHMFKELTHGNGTVGPDNKQHGLRIKPDAAIENARTQRSENR